MRKYVCVHAVIFCTFPNKMTYAIVMQFMPYTCYVKFLEKRKQIKTLCPVALNVCSILSFSLCKSKNNEMLALFNLLLQFAISVKL